MVAAVHPNPYGVPYDREAARVHLSAGVDRRRRTGASGVVTRGQLGDGTLTSEATPTQVGTADDWEAVSASSAAHTCGIRAGGQLYCWGDNTTDQIGDGTTTERTVPTRAGTATDWKQVSTGGAGEYYPPPYPDSGNSFPGHSCAISADGTRFCWGDNVTGQIGDGTMTERHTPTQEVTHSIWRSLAAGARLTCAIRPRRDLYCWGRGDLLGNGMNTSSAVPTQALFGGWVSVSAGGWHVMGLRSGHD